METIKGTHYAGSPLDKLRTTTAKGVPVWRTVTLKHFACSITEKNKKKGISKKNGNGNGVRTSTTKKVLKRGVTQSE